MPLVQVRERGTTGTRTEQAHRGGVPAPAASLAAGTGFAVFKVAFARWVTEPGEPDLPGIFRQAMVDLRDVLADG